MFVWYDFCVGVCILSILFVSVCSNCMMAVRASWMLPLLPLLLLVLMSLTLWFTLLLAGAWGGSAGMGIPLPGEKYYHTYSNLGL